MEFRAAPATLTRREPGHICPPDRRSRKACGPSRRGGRRAGPWTGASWSPTLWPSWSDRPRRPHDPGLSAGVYTSWSWRIAAPAAAPDDKQDVW